MYMYIAQLWVTPFFKDDLFREVKYVREYSIDRENNISRVHGSQIRPVK